MVEFVRGVGEGREVVFGSARSVVVVVVAFRPIAAARTCSLRSLPDLDLAADVVRAGVASLSLGELESLQRELKNCNQQTRETLLPYNVSVFTVWVHEPLHWERMSGQVRRGGRSRMLHTGVTLRSWLKNNNSIY